VELQKAAIVAAIAAERRAIQSLRQIEAVIKVPAVTPSSGRLGVVVLADY